MLVILNKRLETLELIRQETHPPVGDFAEGPLELAVVRWHGLEVVVPLECVVFLSKLPPEPKWIQQARAKGDRQALSELRASVRKGIRADRDEDRAAGGVMNEKKTPPPRAG